MDSPSTIVCPACGFSVRTHAGMSLRLQYDLAGPTRPCMGDDGPALCPTLRALILARPEARERVRDYIQEVVEARYPRTKALASLCEVIEILEPSARAGVTVIDGQRTCIETAVFPRCGENFSKSIESLPIGRPFIGSCAAAVTRCETVTCSDIANDTIFHERWRSLCAASDIGAMQSQPALDPSGTAIGTFVLSFRRPAPSLAWNSDLMRLGASLYGA